MASASRLYLTSRAHGATYLGPLLGDWSDSGLSTRTARGSHHWTFLMDPSNVQGGVITALTFGGPVAGGARIPAGNLQGSVRWAKKARVAGTLSGTLTLCLGVENPSASAFQEVYGHCYAYVANGDTLDLKAVLVPNLTHATNWTVSNTYRTMDFAISGSVDYDAGDLIVIEFGGAFVPATTPPGDFVANIRWGTTNSSGVAQADATNGATAARAAWVDFPSAVDWDDDPPAPDNDACVDAIVIGATPYTSPTVNSTQSGDLLRRVWWKWTATSTGRWFASSLGSNYFTQIRVNTGSCAGLSLVAQGTSTVWIGTGQAVVAFNAVQGQDYFFSVQSQSVTSGINAALTALQSGGACVFSLFPYLPPQTNDLFVDCQHIGVFRDGQLINLSSLAYGDTPTGNAIDYTLRPLDDNNGGVNTSERLYVGLFGSSPQVGILDLATLNVGQFEIDTITTPLTGGQNISTVVFGLNGDILLGWYGDNYAAVDQPPTVPSTAALRQLDATHADNQAGAPWPPAESWLVDLENGGTDFAELAADQDTVFYTSGGQLVKRYRLSTQTQLPDFATLPAPSGPRPGARSVRLLSPGDGSTGALVAYGDRVLRLDSTGAVVQTYLPTDSAQAQDLDKIELSADGLSFWVSDQYSAHIFHFTLAGVETLPALDTHFPPGQLCGFAVYRGYRAGNPPDGPPPEPPEPPGPGPGVDAPGCPPEWPVPPVTGTACAPDWAT